MTSPGPGEHGHDEAGHHDDHPPFLAHHFETPEHQFEAGKLGMWLFLATEVLLFGGLFVGYAVLRHNHPELFAYGSQFLNTKWGAINTVVLIVSSLTMATAVSASQLNKPRLLVVLLSLTFLGGLGFMCIKYVEYSHKFHENLVWGTRFYVTPAGHDAEPEEVAIATEIQGDADHGNTLFQATCRSCHGSRGEGIPGQGKDQRGSAFIAGKTDEELVEFIKVGRMPFDPLNTTGIQMPPKGGNPLLTDADLFDVVAYMRTFGPAPAGAEGEGAAQAEIVADPEFFIPRSSIPMAPPGPPGIVMASLSGETQHAAPHEEPDPRSDPDRPPNAHIFFGIYFCMTGLHGLHVLAGMAVIAWLIFGAVRGRFSSEYFTPVDLGGLYWHIVDLIWIFLFPLFYLIA